MIQLFFLCFGAGAAQNSALHWSSDHRHHHQNCDTSSDPYNINKGFLWAHMGWIFFGDPEHRTFSNSKDLERNRLVDWQHRYYVWIAVFFGLIFPGILGWLLFDRFLGGMIWGGVVRVVVNHHSTFLINSWAHYFGKQTYSTASTAKDSFWLAILSYGEGYHNYHHTFAGDYRNGVRYYQFDPSKWLIFSFEKLGLAWKVSRIPDRVWMKAKMDRQHEIMLARVQEKSAFKNERIEEILEKMTEAKAKADTALKHWWEEKLKMRDLKKARRAETLRASREEWRAMKRDWTIQVRAKKRAYREMKRNYVLLLRQMQMQLRTASV